MRGVLAVAAAEIRQHKLVFWAGLVVGAAPLVLHFFVEGVPLRPATGQQIPGGEGLIRFFALILSVAVAFGLGLTSVPGGLGDRRLGFWLSRPVPLVQYWTGKAGAALLLATIAGALVFLPALLLGSLSPSRLIAVLSEAARALLLVTALAVAVGSVAGGAFRARGVLLMLDIAMLPIVWASAVWALGTRWQAGTGQAVVVLGMPRLLLVAVAVLLLASATQICVGRLELRRGHALLSAITWAGLLFFFVGGILGFSRYVSRATPEDLRLPWVDAPRAGTNVLLSGSSTRWRHHYVAGYLVDERGNYGSIGGLEGTSGLAWSRDGRYLVSSRSGFGPGGPDRPRAFLNTFGWGPTLTVRRLDRSAADERFAFEDDLDVVAVSPSGERVLLKSRKAKNLFEVAGGRIRAEVDDPLPWRHAEFLDEQTVRALRIAQKPRPTPSRGGALNRLVQPAGEMLLGVTDAAAGLATPLEQATVVDWDLASRRVVERGTIALQGSRHFLAGLTPSEDWSSVLRFDSTGLFVHELDGRVRAKLVEGWSARNRIAGPLSGDRYGCVEEDAAGLRFRVFASDGRLLSEARFKGRFPLKVGGEPAAGLLALGVSAPSDEGEPAALLVDLGSGAVVRREPGRSPALRRWEPGRVPSPDHPAPGSLATRLFLGDDGVVSLDPATGAKTVLVARRSRVQED